MVKVTLEYQGGLHCRATHGPSGATVETDAPVDNQGKGESFSPTRKVRLFAGYAGWSPGQLEGEMRRKAWLTFPASLELVFEIPPESLWQKVLNDKGGWKNKLLSQMPEDLASN